MPIGRMVFMSFSHTLLSSLSKREMGSLKYGEVGGIYVCFPIDGNGCRRKLINRSGLCRIIRGSSRML